MSNQNNNPSFAQLTLISSGAAVVKSIFDFFLRRVDRKPESDEGTRKQIYLQNHSHELQLKRDLKLRELTHEHTKEIELLRSQYSIQTSLINRRLQKFEENSPFFDTPEEAASLLGGIYESNRKPLVLIAPFWDNSIAHRANDDGASLHEFRVAINAAWQKTQWFDGVVKCDGYFKRPLRQTDRDIAVISAVLADLPIILIHGMVQAGRKVHPAITVWNLLPEQQDIYFNLDLESFDIQSRDKLEFQDFVAYYIGTVVGILGDAHHLFFSGKHPNLSRYASNKPENLKLLASQFGFYYDLICYKEPTKEHFYRLDQALMLHECSLVEEARKQVNYSMRLWLKQRSPQSEEVTSLEEILEAIKPVITPSDWGYLEKLNEYFIAADNNQACALLQSVISLINKSNKSQNQSQENAISIRQKKRPPLYDPTTKIW